MMNENELELEFSRKQARSIKAKLKLNLLSGFKDPENAEIPEIPVERTLFPYSKKDYWFKIDLGEGVSACVYDLAPKSDFSPHFHFNVPEYMLTVSDLGPKDLEIITGDDYWFAKKSELIHFRENLEHAVINHSNKYCKFIVIWYGMGEGWKGTFTEKNN